MSEPAHFNSPFSFNTRGEAILEREGTQGCVLANTYNVAVCPEGFREDLPEFGVPPLEFQTVPLHLAGLEEALLRWEPESEPVVIEKAVAAAQQWWRELTIEVG